jgi:ATP-dependent exoDNAse (exonuclease V) beta subunit
VPTLSSHLTILERDREFASNLPIYTVVGASAGSGKTRALKQRFLQLLLSDTIPHNRLRNVLAITFTNNAAREMKQRVLGSLKAASLGDAETLEELSAIVTMTPAQLQLSSGRLIDEILDNYSDFQVLTIDSFLSRVFKSSALELGLPPDIEIVLDSDAILDEAFNLLARELSHGTDSARLLRDLLNLLAEGQEAGDRYIWNPYPYLGEKVKDLYKRLILISKELKREDHSAEIRHLSAQLMEHVRRLEALTDRHGLARNDRFEKYLERANAGDVDGLLHLQVPAPPVKKSGSNAGVYEEAVASCQPVCEAATGVRQRLIALKARQHFQPYAEAHALLGRWIDAVKREHGRVDIGDVSKRLAAYLKPGIVPEIYYSLGDRLAHYLIDEFQDTNPIQWETLFPLIGNTLSTDGSLFVVGDTKQSIYGFRGADWKIMKRLQTEDVFPSAKKDLKTLEVNYRSFERILSFTNTVFQTIAPTKVFPGAAQASGLATDQQKVRKEHVGKGYAELVTVTPDDLEKEPGILPHKDHLLVTVADCITRGYRRSDITILSPRNSDTIDISGWLNEKGIPFISHSSLDVRSRKFTADILALLRFLDSPIDDLAFATFLLGDMCTARLHQRNAPMDRPGVHEFLLSHHPRRQVDHPLYVQFRKSFPDLWQLLFEELYNVVGYLPVYDLVSEIFKTYNLFELFPTEEASLVKILEAVKDFEDQGENSLKAFLTFAETSSEDANWNIDIPADADAVRLMTIHKAKGLESSVTIVLLYDAPPKRDSLYCDDEGDEVRLVQVNKDLAGKSPEIMSLYERKELGHVVDELNKLYVALTRSEHELYVISVKGKRGKMPSDLLPDGYLPDKKPSVAPRRVVVPAAVTLSHDLPHRAFAPVDYDTIAVREIRRGEFVHAVLQEILYVGEDLDRQLDEALARTRLKIPLEGDEKQLRSLLVSVLTSADIQPYFVRRPGRMVLNEQEFVMSDGALTRMDRVVVDPHTVAVLDYKTGDEKPGYTDQVEKYMSILRDFYKSRAIEGFLVYVDHNLVRPVR